MESYAMALVDMIGAKLEGFKSRMEDKLRALFIEFRIGRSPCLAKSQQGESSERPPETDEQATDSTQPYMRMDFPRWEEGDPTGWLSRTECYFRYHQTPKTSMVNIAANLIEP
ncbi:hypothetical protein B296_00021606 [Ensete ventricosum]|uniref:Uncharacterized protein n=1 Tax=Ensete ventricosum TaxID=4639 RepID=A0A426ZJ35_ENSVE|nr:hypothetical protein B296_00021606 [Ensete ventricosum]